MTMGMVKIAPEILLELLAPKTLVIVSEKHWKENKMITVRGLPKDCVAKQCECDKQGNVILSFDYPPFDAVSSCEPQLFDATLDVLPYKCYIQTLQEVPI